MAVQIPYSIYTEIQKKSNIRTVQGKHRKDTAAAVQLQRSGNHRRTSDERPYPHAGQHTAKIQSVAIHGIPEGQEQLDDIRQAREPEIQVREPAFLGRSVLREHSRHERGDYGKIYPGAGSP